MHHDRAPGTGRAPLSVLLVTPDGYRLPGLAERLDRAVEAHGLRVVNRCPHVLGADDIADVWPCLVDGSHPVAHQLTLHRMGEGACEVLVVTGPDVVPRCAAVQADVRRDFGDTPLAPRVHTPADPDEAAHWVAAFLHGPPPGAPGRRRPAPAPVPGAFGRLAALPAEEIRCAVRDTWEESRSGRRPPLGPEAVPGEYATYLLPGDPHSLDYGLSVLADALPYTALRHLVRAYVERDARGESRLYTGTAGATGLLADRITAAGLFAQARAVRHPTG
ncbi:hypothetical protein ABZZ17_03825 [Streptomyces sp. NPDC006512]|uniref:hypothetical protein n=1 Tax=Streptomyces sp. NPDC006512 TaxID=3154307 RepID=UPI0033B93D95